MAVNMDVRQGVPNVAQRSNIAYAQPQQRVAQPMQRPPQTPTGPAMNRPQPGAVQNMPSGTYNPLQPSYAPAPPQGVAAMSGANVSPQQSLQMILQGFQPQTQSANTALQNQLAAAGIQGGGAIDAQTALQRNLAAGLAPQLAQTVQGAQGMTLQQSLANQAAQNQMTGTNLQDWMTTNLANQGASNQAGNTLAQMLQQGWGQGLGIFGQLESGGLGAAGGLAGQQAQNFPVYQNTSPLSFLGL